MPYQGMNSGMRRVLMSVPLSLMFVLSFPYVCSVNPYILMKNHGCEAYSSQLWHVFFTTVEKAYHSRAHMINPKASQDKPPCKTQQKPM